MLKPASSRILMLGVLVSGVALGEPPHAHDPEAPEIDYPPEYESPPPRVRRVRPAEIEHHKVAIEGGMLRIPGGEFAMGHDGAPGEPNERPEHLVKVGPFWIDRTEVIVGDLRACADRGDCALRLGSGLLCTFGRAEAKLPVNCVPWHTADAYCRAVGKRLPTEAEWELAASGGQEIRFPWGSSGPSCGVAVTLVSNKTGTSCSPRGPMLVGTHPKGASSYGVEDMAGNVEEWVADWYADRYGIEPSPSAAPSPAGPAFGVAHVLRGGGWMSRPRETRVTARSWGSLNEAGPNVGFRCARD